MGRPWRGLGQNPWRGVSQIHKDEQAQVKCDAEIGKSCYYIASALMSSSFEQAQMHGVAWAKIHGVA